MCAHAFQPLSVSVIEVAIDVIRNSKAAGVIVTPGINAR
jgi:hypothetical protein